jgi:hypothetical protein
MRNKRGQDGCCVLIWDMLAIKFVSSSFLQCIYVSAKYRQIIRRFPCQQPMCNELFCAFPHFELGRRWRCKGDRHGEGDGDFRD